MSAIETLENLIDRPESLTGAERPAGLGRAGLLGYFAGTLGLFMFLRLASAIPPGALSFLTVLGFVLAANFFFAGVIHLFMDLTGASDGRGGAARLFLAFGCSDFLMTMLVPFGFLSKAGFFSGVLGFFLCALALIYSRVRLVRRLYPVSANKALLAVWLPYAGIAAVFFAAMLYGLIWLVWLVV